MLLYVIRHGDPDYARDHLTPRGLLEAQALSIRMGRLAPTHLYSSPMGRAQATAEPTAKLLKKSVKILEWTRELYQPCLAPQVPGQFSWDVHGESIRRPGFIEGLFGRTHWRHRPAVIASKGLKETQKRIAHESDLFLAGHGYERRHGYYEIRRPNPARLAVFCHGGFGLTWLAHLLDLPLAWVYAGFTLTTSSVTTILFDERTPGRAAPRALAVADQSHLFAAGLAVSPAGIKANIN